MEKLKRHPKNRHGRETGTILKAIDALSRQLHKIMSQLTDLIAAATKLSTASDGLSVKCDNLVAAADAVVTALQNTNLPPEGEAALAALTASAATAAAEGDKVDSEVNKLDGVLPTPAPAAPVTPA